MLPKAGRLRVPVGESSIDGRANPISGEDVGDVHGESVYARSCAPLCAIPKYEESSEDADGGVSGPGDPRSVPAGRMESGTAAESIWVFNTVAGAASTATACMARRLVEEEKGLGMGVRRGDGRNSSSSWMGGERAAG